MTFIGLFLFFDKKEVNVEPITLAVKSVNVAAPSSKVKPLANETSKSFTSKEFLFSTGLLTNNS